MPGEEGPLGSGSDGAEQRLGAAQAALRTVLEGQSETVELALACLVTGGHLLLEDAPGTGKTTLARALARVSGLSFSRVQMTADVLPSDVTGAVYPDGGGAGGSAGGLVFRPGPLFASVVLADELNRTPPRTQSALLEAMAERAVTVDGTRHALPDPFFVVATQNPLEFAGTYPLPESQLDRFTVRLRPGYPDRSAEERMLRARRGADPSDALDAVLEPGDLAALRARATELPMAEAVEADLLDLVRATRDARQFALGASPRATLDLDRLARALAVLAGRAFVAPDDVRRAALPALAHRVVPLDAEPGDPEAQEDAVRAVLASVSVPRLSPDGDLVR
ncbi:MAG: MoxR family ATPase [Planctomycetota bacterium]